MRSVNVLWGSTPGVSGPCVGDRRTPVEPVPEGIQPLLQSGTATSRDRAGNTDPKSATACSAKAGEDNGVPNLERAAPRLPSGCYLDQWWPK